MNIYMMRYVDPRRVALVAQGLVARAAAERLRPGGVPARHGRHGQAQSAQFRQQPNEGLRGRDWMGWWLFGLSASHP